MRKQLSMKRLHILSANFLISLAKHDTKFFEDEAQYASAVVQPIVLDFLKYIWEHKDDDGLLDVYAGLKKK